MELYILHLNAARIRLSCNKDNLVWSKNPISGQVTAKSAYKLIATKFLFGQCKWWHSILWKWKISLKVKCFLWLAFNNKILKWEHLN